MSFKPLSIKCPARMDIAGGFLDIWPLPLLIPDTFVINCSLPIGVMVKGGVGESPFKNSFKNPSKKVTIAVQTPEKSMFYSFNKLQDILRKKDPYLDLLKTHCQYWRTEKQFKYLTNKKIWIQWKSESPAGAGLGASSSLCVGLFKLFSGWLKRPMRASSRLHLCRDIEGSVLKTPPGTQDYIPAFYPETRALYKISYARAGIITWEKKKLPKEFFQNHILLINTREPHHSGQNNWQIFKQAIDGNKTLLKGLCQLRDNALKAVDIYEKEDWPAFGKVLQKEYNLRSTLFAGWLTEKSRRLCETLKEKGAYVKLCGAGGGGVAIVFAKNKQHKNRIHAFCTKNKIPVFL